MSKSCIHGFVSGRVQGVWFRAFTRENALALGIDGWANNLPDGRVEFLLCGDNEQLQHLLNLLRIGPPLAEVTSLESEQLPWQRIEGFTTG